MTTLPTDYCSINRTIVHGILDLSCLPKDLFPVTVNSHHQIMGVRQLHFVNSDNSMSSDVVYLTKNVSKQVSFFTIADKEIELTTKLEWVARASCSIFIRKDQRIPGGCITPFTVYASKEPIVYSLIRNDEGEFKVLILDPDGNGE